ncbi:MAG: acyl carrier protein, partial [Thermomonas sp.]
MSTQDASTFDVLREVMAKDHGLAPETLQPETALAELTIDSLALIELIFTLEDRFNVVADNVP